MDFSAFKYIIGGAGLTGSVLAERIANDLGENVLIVEKRDHIGGNCSSETDPQTGIEYHRYGTHVFHTSKSEIWNYITKFVSFNSYFHQVLTVYNNKVYQMPVNLETINSFYGVNLRPFEVRQFITNEINKGHGKTSENFEEHAIDLVGKPLYEAIIKGYTKKQWGREPSDLPSSVIKRLPFRTDYNENYYFDKWQGIPVEEYQVLFERMLSSNKISVLKGTDILNIKENFSKNALLIHTGPIDSFFDFCYGRLGWRSLCFEKEVINVEDYQGTSQMNYAEETIPYTRIHEPRHLHPERDYTKQATLIIKEYPVDNENEHFYPVNDAKSQERYDKYKILMRSFPKVIFAGRLGLYKYFDMDRAIAESLNIYEGIKSCNTMF